MFHSTVELSSSTSKKNEDHFQLDSTGARRRPKKYIAYELKFNIHHQMANAFLDIFLTVIKFNIVPAKPKID